MEPRSLIVCLSTPLVFMAALIGHEDERYRLAGCSALIGFAMGCAEQIFETRSCLLEQEEDA